MGNLSSWTPTRSIRVACAVVIGLGLGLTSGCMRRTTVDYALSEATEALPEQQRQQIEESLTDLFGTPLAPRMLVPTDEVVEDATSEAADARSGIVELFGVTFEEAVDPYRLINGARVYRDHCVGCHGASGDGQGEAAAYLSPKPRDYRRGVFKFTSTPYGMKPVRGDLVRTIRRGAKGTSMPAFPWISEEDLNDVIDYVILLSQRGEVEYYVTTFAESEYDEDDPIEEEEILTNLEVVQRSWADAENRIITPVTPRPAYDEASIAAGRKAFLSRGCSKCHGEDGRGQTEWLSHEFLAEQANKPADQRVLINRDTWGEAAPAADLMARMLHGGRRPLDIYRRIYTGINGTPMPAFGDALASEPDTIWNLVHYVMSIIEDRQIGADATQAETETDRQISAQTGAADIDNE